MGWGRDTGEDFEIRPELLDFSLGYFNIVERNRFCTNLLQYFRI